MASWVPPDRSGPRRWIPDIPRQTRAARGDPPAAALEQPMGVLSISAEGGFARRQGNRILIRRPQPPALPGVGVADGRAVDLPRQSRGLGGGSHAPEEMGRPPMKTRMRLPCVHRGRDTETCRRSVED